MPEQDSLARLIGLARRRLKQAVGARVAGYGLSPQQFWVMVFLDQADGPTLTQLCERLRADAPTASRIVSALTRRGLVKPLRDAGDRRRTFLKLTPAGRRLAAELQPLALEVRGAVERDLDRAEAVELRRLLNKVIDFPRPLRLGRSRRMKAVTLTAIALAIAASVACSRTSRRRAAALAARPPSPSSWPRPVRADVPDRIEAVATVEPVATVSVKAQAARPHRGRALRRRAERAQGRPPVPDRPRARTRPRWPRPRAGWPATWRRRTTRPRRRTRAEQLAAEGVLSREDHDQAIATAAAQKAGAAADAAAVESARLNLAYTQVRAPIGGRTGSVLVHVGNVVKAGDDTPLVVINRIDPIYVSFAVPEQPAGRAARRAERRRAPGPGRRSPAIRSPCRAAASPSSTTRWTARPAPSA